MPSWEHPIAEHIGGRLQSRVLCVDCNSTLGSAVDDTLLSGEVIRLALFDQRDVSPLAGRLFAKFRDRLNRPVDESRLDTCQYRTLTVPQYVVRIDEPELQRTTTTILEPQHLRSWWADEVSRRRAAGLVVAGEREFLASAWQLRDQGSTLVVPVPGGGELTYSPSAEAVYEFRRQVPWQPIVKMALLTLTVFRNDLEFDVLLPSGPAPLGALLRSMAGMASPLPSPLSRPSWPAPPCMQVDVRWVLEVHRVIRITVAVFGANCGSVRVRARPSPHPLNEFIHYTSKPEIRHEWLFGSRADYDARRAVALHEPTTAESLLRDLSGDSVPSNEFPPSSGQP